MSFCLDTQCLSYLIGALGGVSKPVGQLAIERTSLVRIFFYVASHFEITPTVKEETLKISDKSLRTKHESWINTHFGPRLCWKESQLEQIEERRREFQKLHSGISDCQILAEAEVLGFSTLLSYDFRFLDHLSNQTTIYLLKPSEYWDKCNVPEGASPLTGPKYDNPLYYKDWWNW